MTERASDERYVQNKSGTDQRDIRLKTENQETGTIGIGM
jgi:hypothetical protein